VHLAVTTIGTSIGVGYTPWTILGVMTIMGPWLLAHWEEYHSGIMLYGNGYWGVTEANYLMIALHFFTAAVGPGVPVICTDYAGSQVSLAVYSCVSAQ
jgi:ethanolaminephosphotransferase